MKLLAPLLALMLTSCLNQSPRSDTYPYIQEIGEFSSPMSVCNSLSFVAEDKEWLLYINLREIRTTLSPDRIHLMDFRHFQDPQCGISLFRNSDIRCESQDPVRIPATQANGLIRFDTNREGRRIFAVELDQVLFSNGYSIESARLHGVPYSNFCPG